MPTVDGVRITDQHRERYVRDGFFVLERAISPSHLELLRNESDHFLARIHAEMDAAGTDTLPGCQRGKRYFIANRYQEAERLHEFLFGDLMADVCRATIGPEAYLFYEQYVIKGAETGTSFAWHQDSGYVAAAHEPYVSCWCALDDVDETNGTVYLLPYERAGTRKRVEHVREPGGPDLIGYHGDDPGDPIIVPAGSVAVFSSTCFHRSGANHGNRLRRVYLAQYSSHPIMNRDGTKLAAFAESLLRNGQKVAPAVR